MRPRKSGCRVRYHDRRITVYRKLNYRPDYTLRYTDPLYPETDRRASNFFSKPRRKEEGRNRITDRWTGSAAETGKNGRDTRKYIVVLFLSPHPCSVTGTIPEQRVQLPGIGIKHRSRTFFAYRSEQPLRTRIPIEKGAVPKENFRHNP